MPPSNNKSPQKPGLWIRRADQAIVAALVLLVLLSMGGYWLSRQVGDNRLIEIDRAEPLMARYAVDINAAEWPEFAQLPGIGETLARRIVEERTASGPFVDHLDMQIRVPGIGPVTLEQIEPYLLPVPPGANVAGGEETTSAG